MVKDRKEIDLPPTEYRADIPNKREPVFNAGGLEWLLAAIVLPAVIGMALKYFGLR